MFTLSRIDRQPPPRAPPSGWPAATRRACCSRGQERPAPRPGRLASLKKSKEPAARESVSLTGGIFKAGPCVLLAGAEGTASVCEEELEAHKAGRATQGPSTPRLVAASSSAVRTTLRAGGGARHENGVCSLVHPSQGGLGQSEAALAGVAVARHAQRGEPGAHSSHQLRTSQVIGNSRF